MKFGNVISPHVIHMAAVLHVVTYVIGSAMAQEHINIPLTAGPPRFPSHDNNKTLKLTTTMVRSISANLRITYAVKFLTYQVWFWG